MARNPPQVLLASLSDPHQWTEGPIRVIQVSVPARILLPRDCVAEIFTVPQGTEIKIRYTSKLPRKDDNSLLTMKEEA